MSEYTLEDLQRYLWETGQIWNDFLTASHLPLCKSVRLVSADVELLPHTASGYEVVPGLLRSVLRLEVVPHGDNTAPSSKLDNFTSHFSDGIAEPLNPLGDLDLVMKVGACLVNLSETNQPYAILDAFGNTTYPEDISIHHREEIERAIASDRTFRYTIFLPRWTVLRTEEESDGDLIVPSEAEFRIVTPRNIRWIQEQLETVTVPTEVDGASRVDDEDC